MVCWATDIPFLTPLIYAVILCGTKNINKDPPYEIAHGLIAISSALKNQSNNPNIVICGTLSRNKSFSINRLIINEVNNINKSKCLVKSFHLLNQNNGWRMEIE